MAKRRKYSGILLYNLLMKEVTAINRNLPETRKLSVAERREFISQKVYPAYKKFPLSGIRIKELRKDLIYKVQRLPRKKTCNVLLIPPDSYTSKEYFMADGFMRETLQCINLRFSAGEFGSTKIFNTRDHDYHSAGVKEITDKLNKWADENRRPSDDLPVYAGKVQLMPGKQDDGKEGSYFLDMILYIDNMPQSEYEVLKIKKKRKKSRREEILENNVSKYMKEQISQLIVEKTKIKRIRKKIVVAVNIFKGAVGEMKRLSKKTMSKDFEDSLEKAFLKRESSYLEKYFKSGKINKRQKEEMLKILSDGLKKQETKKKKK